MTNEYGFDDYSGYDLCICGNDIPEIILWIEHYSGIDTTEVRNGIEAKRIWLRDNKENFYNEHIGEDRDIFEMWLEKGYIHTPEMS